MKKRVLFTGLFFVGIYFTTACGIEYNDGPPKNGGSDAGVTDDAATGDDANTGTDAATGTDTNTGTDAATGTDTNTGTDAATGTDTNGCAPCVSDGYDLNIMAYTNSGAVVDLFRLNGTVVNVGGDPCSAWGEPLALGVDTNRVSYIKHVAENFWFFRYNTSMRDNNVELPEWLAMLVDHNCEIMASTRVDICDSANNCVAADLDAVQVWWPGDYGCSVTATLPGRPAPPQQLDCR